MSKIHENSSPTSIRDRDKDPGANGGFEFVEPDEEWEEDEEQEYDDEEYDDEFEDEFDDEDE